MSGTCETSLCDEWNGNASTAVATHVNHWPKWRSTRVMLLCAKCVYPMAVRCSGKYDWDRYLPILRLSATDPRCLHLERGLRLMAGEDVWSERMIELECEILQMERAA